MVRKMKYVLVQLWYQITCPIVALYKRIKRRVSEWFEWMDALCWAKDYHPAWVHYAKKSRHKETREYYRKKILAAYRGEEDGKEQL